MCLPKPAPYVPQVETNSKLSGKGAVAAARVAGGGRVGAGAPSAAGTASPPTASPRADAAATTVVVLVIIISAPSGRAGRFPTVSLQRRTRELQMTALSRFSPGWGSAANAQGLGLGLGLGDLLGGLEGDRDLVLAGLELGQLHGALARVLGLERDRRDLLLAIADHERARALGDARHPRPDGDLDALTDRDLLLGELGLHLRLELGHLDLRGGRRRRRAIVRARGRDPHRDLATGVARH